MLSSIKAEISNFCILLPKLDHFGTPTSAGVHQHEGDRQQIHVQYTVIDSEWNVLHHKNSYVCPVSQVRATKKVGIRKAS
jgi:hypothetical protein